MFILMGTAAAGLTSFDREELSWGFLTNQLFSLCYYCLVEEELWWWFSEETVKVEPPFIAELILRRLSFN